MTNFKVTMPCVRFTLSTRRFLVTSSAVTERKTESVLPSNTALTKHSPLIISSQLTPASRATLHQEDVIRGMQSFVEAEVLSFLKPVGDCWQPQDYLPQPESQDFLDQVHQLQQRAAQLPDDYLLVLVGDMVTEEALPTYMHMLNTFQGVTDETGAAQNAWAQWTRLWTAEENRHGDLLHKYCYLTGRVDMRAVECTIQRLIGSGMKLPIDRSPYMGFVYTSFQERATKLSHGHTAHLAKQHGDDVLGGICGAVAADEWRHEKAYQKIMEEIFRLDPDGAVISFAEMMRRKIVMPAHLMDDGEHGKQGRNLFSDFSAVAESTGTYTAFDYADILEYLVNRWDVQHLSVTSPEAAEAQEYVCTLAPRIRRLVERAAERGRKTQSQPVGVTFSWIFNRTVGI